MATETTRSIPREALSLSAFPLALKLAEEGSKKRLFDGVANSGAPLKHWYWDRFVIDFDSVALSDVTPGLIGHDFDQRAAVGRLSVDGGQLLVAGHLLSNEHGKQVAQDADEGFPWQLSIYVEPGSVERFEAGTQVTVNGRTIDGPIAVFRNNKFNEFSFTPVGVDTNTEARVLSTGGEGSDTIEIREVHHMANQGTDGNQNIEQLQAKVADLQGQVDALTLTLSSEKTRADEAESQLTTALHAQRDKDVREFLSAKGMEYTEEAAKPYLEMSQDVWDAVQRETKTLLSRDNGAGGQHGLPPQFFQRDQGSGAGLSQDENPIIADAKRRAAAAA